MESQNAYFFPYHKVVTPEIKTVCGGEESGGIAHEATVYIHPLRPVLVLFQKCVIRQFVYTEGLGCNCFNLSGHIFIHAFFANEVAPQGLWMTTQIRLKLLKLPHQTEISFSASLNRWNQIFAARHLLLDIITLVTSYWFKASGGKKSILHSAASIFYEFLAVRQQC